MGAASTKPLKLGVKEGGNLDKAAGGTTAKAKKTQNAPDLPQIPSDLRVNMKTHNLGDIKVGQKIKGTFHGTVKGHHHDDYGHHANIEVHKLDVATGNVDSGPKK